MTNITVLKDAKLASKKDLQNLMVSVQSIINTYHELADKMDKAPIAVKLFLEEHGNDVKSLNIYRDVLKHAI